MLDSIKTSPAMANGAYQTVSDSTRDGTYTSIDASYSNPIYGNSNTVQPPAIQLVPQIKY